jgi:fumarate reductase subunit D
MSLIPDFEIGIWNAWFIIIYILLVGMLPGFFIDADKAKKLENIPSYNKIEKTLALATHVFIMLVLALYCSYIRDGCGFRNENNRCW